MTQTIKDLMDDKDFIEKFVQKMIQERKETLSKKKAFYESATFQSIHDILVSNKTSIDSEGFGYFPEKTKKDAGVSAFSDEDIEMFLSFCDDPESEFVVEGSVSQDEENPFLNFTYKVKDLSVFFMSGQGTFIRVCGGE